METPLFAKYRTNSGTPYIFDADTGRIIRASEETYVIIDDFGILDAAEIHKKYPGLAEEKVREALEAIGRLQSQRCLLGHEPTLPAIPEQVLFQGETRPTGKFLHDKHSVLVLGVTDDCMLRCDYCVFGEHYEEFRNHGVRRMSLDTARRAVAEFLGHSVDDPAIGFYGGEPLLEFGLIKEVVQFGEQRAAELGKRVFWNISTNAVILDREKRRFLCEHRFLVSISLDGPKELNDRYRVFAHPDPSNKERRGSFDTVMKNVKAFIEEYPDYPMRSVLTTVAPPYDFEDVERLITELDSFFTGRCAFVDEFESDFLQAIYSGKCAQGGCSTVASGFAPALAVDREADHGAVRSMMRDFLEQMKARGIEGCMNDSHGKFLIKMCLMPLLAMHKRFVTDRKRDYSFNFTCFPGHSRLFCDADGVYYPCERVVTSDMLRLGDVQTGFDPDKAMALIRRNQQVTDCGNCIACTSCPICFVHLRTDEDGGFSGEALRRACKQTVASFITNLALYTEIMESNPDAFRGPMGRAEDRPVPAILGVPPQAVTGREALPEGDENWLTLQQRPV